MCPFQALLGIAEGDSIVFPSLSQFQGELFACRVQKEESLSSSAVVIDGDPPSLVVENIETDIDEWVGLLQRRKEFGHST